MFLKPFMSENGFILLLYLINNCVGIGVQALNYFLYDLNSLIHCLLVSIGIGKKSSAILTLDSFCETYLLFHFLDASLIFCVHGILKSSDYEPFLVLGTQ